MDVGSVNSKGNVDSAKSYSVKSGDDDFERRLRVAAEKGDDAELKQVCKEFESIFINMMYKQMKATVPKSDYLKSDAASEIYESMMDDKLVEASAQKGMGLADVMYKQLVKKYSNTGSIPNAAGGVVDEKK